MSCMSEAEVILSLYLIKYVICLFSFCVQHHLHDIILCTILSSLYRLSFSHKFKGDSLWKGSPRDLSTGSLEKMCGTPKSHVTFCVEEWSQVFRHMILVERTFAVSLQGCNGLMFVNHHFFAIPSYAKLILKTGARCTQERRCFKS